MAPRRATSADALEVARLRAVMFEAVGGAVPDGWVARCADALGSVLDGEPTVAVFVVDDGTGRLLSAATGRWTPRLLPSVRTDAANTGELLSVATDPAHRRRGHARACTAAVLDWLAGHDVSEVRLRASDEGRRLYAGLGFDVLPGTLMTWRPPQARSHRR